MTTSLSDSARVRHADGPLTTSLDGEVIALNVARGNYYAMGETGSRVWELTAEPTELGKVVSQLCSEFDVDEDRCRTEVLAFAADLLDENLIIVVP